MSELESKRAREMLALIKERDLAADQDLLGDCALWRNRGPERRAVLPFARSGREARHLRPHPSITGPIIACQTFGRLLRRDRRAERIASIPEVRATDGTTPRRIAV
ncbi:MAG TPA: hypothetical protein VGC93_03605 [Thermoanaerobaculia bacterium]